MLIQTSSTKAWVFCCVCTRVLGKSEHLNFQRKREASSCYLPCFRVFRPWRSSPNFPAVPAVFPAIFFAIEPTVILLITLSPIIPATNRNTSHHSSNSTPHKPASKKAQQSSKFPSFVLKITKDLQSILIVTHAHFVWFAANRYIHVCFKVPIPLTTGYRKKSLYAYSSWVLLIQRSAFPLL